MTLSIGEHTKSRLRSLSGNASSLLHFSKKKNKKDTDGSKSRSRSRSKSRGRSRSRSRSRSHSKSQGNRRVQRSMNLYSGDPASGSSASSVQESEQEAEPSVHGSSRNNAASAGSGINDVKIQSSRQSLDNGKNKARSLRISTSVPKVSRMSPSSNDLQLHVPGKNDSSTEVFNQTAVTRAENTDPLGSRLRANNSANSLSDQPSTTVFTKFKSSKGDSATPEKGKSEESETGLFSSLISAVHNAANHLIPKSTTKSSSSGAEDGSPTADGSQLVVSGTPDMNTPSTDPFNHSGSFLNHLDFLLSPTANNNLLLKKTTTLDSLNSSNSSASSVSHQLTSPSSTMPAYDDDEYDRGGHADDIGSVGTYMDKVKFKSLKQDSLPPISTFGKGNLTLDAVEKDASDTDPYEYDVPHVLITSEQAALRENSQSPNSMSNDATSNTSIAASGSNSIENYKARTARSTRPDVFREMTMRSLSPAAATKFVTTPLRNSFSARNGGRANSISKGNDSVQLPAVPTRQSTSDIPLKKKEKEPELQDTEYASAKRNTDFHSIFKDTVVSPTERLIADYSCALSKEILVQGRLYISDRHICFYSNILGWVKTVIVPFKEIVQIEQKNTAVLFPNAIMIQTLHDKFLFASFISRDSTFGQIMDVWNQTIIDKISKPKRGTIGSGDLTNDENLTFHSDSSSIESEDDDQRNDGNSGTISDSYDEGDDVDRSDESDAGDNDDDDDDIDTDDMTTGSDESSSSASDRAKPGNLSKTSSSLSLEKLGPTKHEPTTADYTPKENEKEMGDATFNAPLGTVLNILYGPDTSLFDRILKAQGNYDISKLNELITSKKREYVYTKPISGSIGPSKTRCEIVETVDKFDLKNYVQVTQSTKNPDIPSGNSFVVKTVFLFSWADDNSTNLKVYTFVDWSSKSWIKAAVEKGTFDGIKSSTKTLIEEVEDIIEERKDKSDYAGSRKESEETSSSLPTLGPKEHAPTETTFDKSSGYEVIDDKINFSAPVGNVFQILCGDDTSYMKRILERQKNIEISDIPAFQNKTRKYNYVKPLGGSIGPKQAKCYIEEKIESDDIDTCMVLEQISKTPDIPSGNSFEVHTKFYLSWGEKNTTNVLAATNIEWSGKSWIKSAIQKGSINGQKTSVQDMVAEIKDILSSASSTVRRRPTLSKKRTDKSKTKRKNVSKSTENQDEPKEGALETVKQVSGIVKDILSDLPPFVLIGSAVAMILLVLLLPKLYSSLFSRTPTAHFITSSTIVMDGEEYYVVPALESYRGQQRRSNKNKAYNKLYSDSESDIWSWIESHSGPKSDEETEQYANINGSTSKATEHKKQSLREVIRLTELQLAKLKEKANLTNDPT
ncbi:unnamed protein product [Kluyveromyces dobzhanskii CBS 2104]|uniref:WGS project CCBQ000000000 data, contig 00008 n=1 Tax=Kluyveromyces dobzhanskii CBS 2104 TaxID=1427455 RepID=A0A0A8L9Q2_9SACH|nr:unnamed protein product [Kluyveromyces dobzhanskii CBS 2104]